MVPFLEVLGDIFGGLGDRFGQPFGMVRVSRSHPKHAQTHTMAPFGYIFESFLEVFLDVSLEVFLEPFF